MSNPDRGRADASTHRLAKMPELHQLAIFLNVVETRSFTATARLLGLSQPAISQAIARLEDIYGGDLFERRRGAPLFLTPVGKAILPSAQTILRAVDQQKADATMSAQGRKGDLTLGTFPGLSAGPLRVAIAEFLAESPEVRLHLVEEDPHELHRRLRDRSIDCMLAVSPPADISAGLATETLWEEQVIVAIPANHPLARETAPSWSGITSMPILLGPSRRKPIDYRALLDAEISNALEVEWHDVSQNTLLDMVGLGMGATLIIESGLVPHRNVAFRSINGRRFAVPIHLTWIQEDRNPLRHHLLKSIRQRTAAARTPLTLLFPAAESKFVVSDRHRPIL